MRSDYFNNMLCYCYVSRPLYGVHTLLKISPAERVMYRLFSIICLSLNCCLKMSSLGSLSCNLHLYMCHLPVIIRRSITLSVTTFCFVPNIINCSDRDRESQLVQVFLTQFNTSFQNW